MEAEAPACHTLVLQSHVGESLPDTGSCRRSYAPLLASRGDLSVTSTECHQQLKHIEVICTKDDHTKDELHILCVDGRSGGFPFPSTLELEDVADYSFQRWLQQSLPFHILS